jgi:hypothetical protein
VLHSRKTTVQKRDVVSATLLLSRNSFVYHYEMCISTANCVKLALYTIIDVNKHSVDDM